MNWIRIDKMSGAEEPITEEKVREKISTYYLNIDVALEFAKLQGRPVETNFARYEFRE